MVLSLGNHLIKNHEVELFEEFVISMRSFFMPNDVAAIFLSKAIAHYAIDCVAVIYALFDRDELKLSSNKLSVAKKNCDNVKVSQPQINASVALISSKTPKNSSLIEFLKIATPEAAKRCIRLLLDYRMIGF